MEALRITLVRSPIGHPKKQREVLRTLGLKKLNSSVIKSNDPVIQGMIKRVSHLVRVETVEEKERE
ncbi:MAG TPA: 50S ribosomal protein L30 [Syntrophomonadaceae bacterium]|nr:50S ribosomal protein L30 [Syntrophomonadaceae bacterium]